MPIVLTLINKRYIPLEVIDNRLNEAKPVDALKLTVELDAFSFPLDPHFSNANKERDADHW